MLGSICIVWTPGAATIKETRKVINLTGRFCYMAGSTNAAAPAPQFLTKRTITIKLNCVRACDDTGRVLECRPFQTDRLRHSIHDATLSRSGEHQYFVMIYAQGVGVGVQGVGVGVQGVGVGVQGVGVGVGVHVGVGVGHGST